MRLAAALAAGLVSVLSAGLAHAEGDNAPDNTGYQSKAQRRSDFTLGASGGLGIGRASGYPNEIQKIDDRAYRSNTKLALGNGGLFWLGVAFNDYLNFGFAFGAYNLSGNNREASAGIFGFHIDAYPLFDFDKNLQDLAVFGNLGTGPLVIKGGPEEADGGLLAYVEGGISYERWRLWRIGIGPTASVIHMWSDSAQLTGALLGARLAFYAGP